MKTVDMFANVIGQMAQDTHVRRYGTILLKCGKGGLATLSPAAVWVDATIAVTEAARSYLRYCTETEITQQLRTYNATLEAMLINEAQIDTLELEALRHKRAHRLANGERTLTATKHRLQLTRKKIRQQLDLLNCFHELLDNERQKKGSFQDLVSLQISLDCCIDATLTLLLSSNGDLT